MHIFFLTVVTDHFTIFSVNTSRYGYFSPDCKAINRESCKVPQLQYNIPTKPFLDVDFKATFWILQGVWNKRQNTLLYFYFYFILFFSVCSPTSIRVSRWNVFFEFFLAYMRWLICRLLKLNAGYSYFINIYSANMRLDEAQETKVANFLGLSHTFLVTISRTSSKDDSSVIVCHRTSFFKLQQFFQPICA
jgi:hypothetical protein